MNQPKIEQLIAAYKKKNYRIFNGFDFSDNGKFKTFDLNIFGIRARNQNQGLDAFDDLIGVFYYVTTEHIILRLWPGTTDPGKYYLQNLMNPSGAFIMMPGQYQGAYKIGLHHTQDALVQIGNIRGYRDNNKDSILNYDMSKIYEGSRFGVNIHHKENDSENIGMGSAGCQVFKNTPDHAEFMGLCHQAAAVWGNSFSYTLLTEEDVFE